jgi:hypothetical protein
MPNFHPIFVATYHLIPRASGAPFSRYSPLKLPLLPIIKNDQLNILSQIKLPPLLIIITYTFADKTKIIKIKTLKINKINTLPQLLIAAKNGTERKELPRAHEANEVRRITTQPIPNT